MSKFGVSFIVDSKHLGSLMEVLQPYKVEELNFKLVAGTATRVRAGDISSRDMVVKLADRMPRRMAHFRDALLAAGFQKGTVYNAVDEAIKRKSLVKKMVDGVPHYVKAGK